MLARQGTSEMGALPATLCRDDASQADDVGESDDAGDSAGGGCGDDDADIGVDDDDGDHGVGGHGGDIAANGTTQLSTGERILPSVMRVSTQAQKGRRPPRRSARLHATLQGYVWPLCTASSDEHRPRRCRSPKSFLRSLLLFVSAPHKSEQCILLMAHSARAIHFNTVVFSAHADWQNCEVSFSAVGFLPG